MNTIRIKKGSGGLSYEIIDQDEAVLADSVEFRSICRVEDALLELRDVASDSTQVTISSDGIGNYHISKIGSRRKLKFKRIASEKDLRVALASIENAQILDSRPVSQRRIELTGTLKSMT